MRRTYLPRQIVAIVTAVAGVSLAASAAFASAAGPGDIRVGAVTNPASTAASVGCSFFVAFYDVDPGAHTASFTFTGHGGTADGDRIALAVDSPTRSAVRFTVPAHGQAGAPAASFGFRLDLAALRPAPTGPLSVQVSATVDGAGVTPRVFTSTCAVPPSTVTDLALTAADTVDPVSTGAAVSYLLTVRNVGTAPVPSGAARLTDDVPAPLRVASASGAGFACTTAGQAVRCTNTAPLAPRSAHLVVVRTTAVGPAGAVTDSATVTAADDANHANDTAVVHTTIAGAAPPAQPTPVAAPAATFSDTCPATVGVALTNTGTGPAVVVVTAPDGSAGSVSLPAGTATPVIRDFPVTATQRVLTVAAPGFGPLTHTFAASCATIPTPTAPTQPSAPAPPTGSVAITPPSTPVAPAAPIQAAAPTGAAAGTTLASAPKNGTTATAPTNAIGATTATAVTQPTRATTPTTKAIPPARPARPTTAAPTALVTAPARGQVLFAVTASGTPAGRAPSSAHARVDLPTGFATLSMGDVSQLAAGSLSAATIPPPQVSTQTYARPPVVAPLSTSGLAPLVAGQVADQAGRRDVMAAAANGKPLPSTGSGVPAGASAIGGLAVLAGWLMLHSRSTALPRTGRGWYVRRR